MDGFKACCRSKRKVLQISWLFLANIADRSQEEKEQKRKKSSSLTCDPAATASAKYCTMQDLPKFWARGEPGGHAIQERLISYGHHTPTTQQDVEAERSSLSQQQDIAEFILKSCNYERKLLLLRWGKVSELNGRCQAGVPILASPLRSARSLILFSCICLQAHFPPFFLPLWAMYIQKKIITGHLLSFYKKRKLLFLD